MVSLRDQAEALANALQSGAVTTPDVIRWADAVIAQEAHPHWTLCEVACAGRVSPADLVVALRELPGSFERATVADLEVLLFLEWLKRDATCASLVARGLYERASCGDLDNSSVRQIALWAWDAIDLAEGGCIVDTVPQVVGKLREGLQAAASDATRKGHLWPVDVGLPGWVERLSTALGLNPYSRDWGVENASPLRLREFATFFMSHVAEHPWDHEALAELVLASANDALLEGHDDVLVDPEVVECIHRIEDAAPRQAAYWRTLSDVHEFPVRRVLASLWDQGPAAR